MTKGVISCTCLFQLISPGEVFHPYQFINTYNQEECVWIYASFKERNCCKTAIIPVEAVGLQSGGLARVDCELLYPLESLLTRIGLNRQIASP